MFIGICCRSQVSVYRTIGPLVCNSNRHFDHESEWTLGTMCAQLLQFNPIILKLYRCLDHTLKICIFRLIFTLLLQFELSRFSDILAMKVNGQRVPCVRNSSSSLDDF